VRDYIPEFRLHDAVATDRVTVRDLLCHQTGLPRHDWVWMPGDRSTAELLGPLRHLELSRDIRAAWQYNNLCYNVAGLPPWVLWSASRTPEGISVWPSHISAEMVFR